jgi:hypothetical protein
MPISHWLGADLRARHEHPSHNPAREGFRQIVLNDRFQRIVKAVHGAAKLGLVSRNLLEFASSRAAGPQCGLTKQLFQVLNRACHGFRASDELTVSNPLWTK